MLVAAQWWYKSSDSCEPIVEQSLPTCYADGQKRWAWELEGAAILWGAQVVYREPVVAIPVEGAISGVTDTSDLHAPEDPQPTQHPALLVDVIAQQHP